MSIIYHSYDGVYPVLCHGELHIEVNGVHHRLKYALQSGGSICKNKNWDMWTEQGEWSVNLPDELKQYEDEIIRLVNENVPYGCCGGCC